jgi:HEAT repeat protein
MPLIGGTVRDLIESALGDSDPDGPLRWQVISLLQERGDLETFTEARRLCAARSAAERLLGVDILGRLGLPEQPFKDRTLPLLRALSVHEDDPMVLYSILIAFGHLGDPRSLPSVILLSESDDARVRYGAAYALPKVMGLPPDPTGLAALRRLSDDADDDVAEWARLGVALATGGEVEDLRR